EHAHVVGSPTVHSALAEFGAAEEIASAHDDGDLHTARVARGLRGRGRDLPGEGAHDVGIDPEHPAAEGLTREFQENPTALLLLLGHRPSVSRPAVPPGSASALARNCQLNSLQS